MSDSNDLKPAFIKIFIDNPHIMPRKDLIDVAESMFCYYNSHSLNEERLPMYAQLCFFYSIFKIDQTRPKSTFSFRIVKNHYLETLENFSKLHEREKTSYQFLLDDCNKLFAEFFTRKSSEKQIFKSPIAMNNFISADIRPAKRARFSSGGLEDNEWESVNLKCLKTFINQFSSVRSQANLSFIDLVASTVLKSISNGKHGNFFITKFVEMFPYPKVIAAYHDMFAKLPKGSVFTCENHLSWLDKSVIQRMTVDDICCFGNYLFEPNKEVLHSTFYSKNGRLTKVGAFLLAVFPGFTSDTQNLINKKQQDCLQEAVYDEDVEKLLIGSAYATWNLPDIEQSFTNYSRLQIKLDDDKIMSTNVNIDLLSCVLNKDKEYLSKKEFYYETWF